MLLCFFCLTLGSPRKESASLMRSYVSFIGSALTCTRSISSLYLGWGDRNSLCRAVPPRNARCDARYGSLANFCQGSAYQQILFNLFGFCPWNLFAPFSDCKFGNHSSISISWLIITFHFLSTSQYPVGLFTLNGTFLNFNPATSILAYKVSAKSSRSKDMFHDISQPLKDRCR